MGKTLMCGKACDDCHGEGGQDFSGHYINCFTCFGSGLAKSHNGTKVKRMTGVLNVWNKKVVTDAWAKIVVEMKEEIKKEGAK